MTPGPPASKDYDCLLFGAPRLLRFLTVSGKEFLPSNGTFRPILPELIDADALLKHYGIARAQLVDLAILVGTDFCDGIKGIGPKKALKLVIEFGSIDNMPAQIREAIGPCDRRNPADIFRTGSNRRLSDGLRGAGLGRHHTFSVRRT